VISPLNIAADVVRPSGRYHVRASRPSGAWIIADVSERIGSTYVRTTIAKIAEREGCKLTQLRKELELALTIAANTPPVSLWTCNSKRLCRGATVAGPGMECEHCAAYRRAMDATAVAS
jgi:hypothetical protein